MPAWQRPDPPARWLRMTQPAYVGRGPEFEVLEQIWSRVADGFRHAVFVGAEAGGGKTRFVVEAALALQEQGAGVLAGGCRQDMGLALDPFVEPIETFLAGLDPSADLRPRTLGHLEVATDGGRWDLREEVLSRQELCSAVVDALRVATEPGPLVLVLEDLHWAGPAARDLLGYVVSRTEDLPLLVLATMRSAPPDRSEALGDVVSDLFRLDGVTRLDLSGLDVEEIAAFLQRNGIRSGSEGRRAAAIMRDATGGNPFLVRETCRDLSDGGDDWTPSAPVPYATSIASRLAALTPVELLVVTVAAVMGEEVQVAELADAAGRLAGRPVGRDDVLVALTGAKAAGLLDPTPGELGVARFPHALARQAVSESLGDLALARIHEAVALALDEGHPAATRRTVRLAAHFAGAAVLGYEKEAVRHLRAAGDLAGASSAHGEAADCFELAASYADDPVDRDRLLLLAARSALLAWENERSRALNERVVRSGDPELRLRAAVGHAGTAWHDTLEARHSRGLLRAALTDPAAGPPDLLVHAHASLARLEAWSGDPDTGRRLGARARDDARALGDPDLLAKVLSITLNDGSGLEELDDVVLRAEELRDLGAGRAGASLLGPGVYHRCVAHYVRGDPEDLKVAVHELRDFAEATAQPFWWWCSSAVSFGLALCSGDLGLATETLGTMRRQSAGGGAARGQGPDGMTSFALRRETGLPPSARSFLRPPGEAGTWAPGALALATELRETDLAGGWLQHLLAGDLADLAGSSSWPATLSFLVDATVLTEDHAAAERLRPMVDRYAGRNLVAGEFLHPLGSADRAAAQLLSLLGRPGADERFEAALAMDERMGAHLHVATTLAAYARHATLRPRPTTDAGRLVARARTLADRFGLTRVRRDLDELAARDVPRWGLTPREREVLALLGRGLSNREISETLVISEYTAANHVRSILMKTDSANRTQAAVLAGELQPSTPASEPSGRTR